MSEVNEDNDYYVVKLTINYETIRRICVQRLKKDKESKSLKENIKINKLKKFSIDYVPKETKKEAAGDTDTTVKMEADKTTTTIFDERQESKLKKIYQDYDVTLTYFDEDGDEIAMSSDIELFEALDNLKRTNRQSEIGAHILYVNAIVSGEGIEETRGGIKAAYMKRCASQRARTRFGIDKLKNSRLPARAQRIFNNFAKLADPSFHQKSPKTGKNCKEEEGTKSSQDRNKNHKEKFDSEFVHNRHVCDGCSASPIVGIRFRATNVPNFDFCQTCKKNYDVSGMTGLTFQKAQHNPHRNIEASCQGMCLFREDKQLADAIKMSFISLAEEDVKRKPEKEKDEKEGKKISEGKSDNEVDVTGAENKTNETFQDAVMDVTECETLKEVLQPEEKEPVKTQHATEQEAKEKRLDSIHYQEKGTLAEISSGKLRRVASEDDWSVVSEDTKDSISILQAANVVPPPLDGVVLNHWDEQLLHLRELGFTDEAECAEVLEILYAANVGSNNNEPVTVEHAVDYIMTKLR